MKTIVTSMWFRLMASAVVATIVVVVVVGSAIRYYEPEQEDRALSALQEIRIVSLAENPALADAIRRERERNGDVSPRNEPPPLPPSRPSREIAGFVQVEYTINPDGSVSDVRVIGAAPAGVYEEQAVAEVRRSMHAPVFNDAGEAVARRTTEIVEFSVPASRLAESRRQQQ